MSSIALALTRDFLRRSVWPIVLALGYLIGLPALFYVLARGQGVPIPEEVFQRLLLSFNIGCFIGFIVVVWVAQGENRFGIGPRLYVLPIETWLAVACRMLQCGLIVALLSLLTIGAYNLIFGLTWPWLGSALSLAVVAVWLQAAFWSLLDFRLSKLVALLLVIASLIWWIVTRYPTGIGLPGSGRARLPASRWSWPVMRWRHLWWASRARPGTAAEIAKVLPSGCRKSRHGSIDACDAVVQLSSRRNRPFCGASGCAVGWPCPRLWPACL